MRPFEAVPAPLSTALPATGMRRRRLLAATGLLLCAGLQPALAGPGDLPARNLLVEWRMAGQGSSQLRQGGIQTGRVIIDSRRGVIGQAGVTYGTTQTESSGNSVQQVTVLNGGRARLFFGSSQPVTTWQWAWAPGQVGGGSGGWTSYGPLEGSGNSPVQVVPQTTWIDLGQGLIVTPRWPGGRAPVTVELEARSSEPAQPGGAYSGRVDPDGQVRRTEVGSTVSVPLGEWTVVARNGGQNARAQSGTLSTRSLDESRSEQLEIRITAP
ncbi:hypothetical protein [Aquabacterium parvum]|uniref:hypothetical protein n=1 Tax=Aquabacterium parvum TaxID=70584 RepID=UPI0007190466|nr:hypothetical protein [Aquabacterium parvum]MBU0915400.1 hypothetical protein [Gammaproteobacteria bacterium]